jgi:nicotinamidase-related amidase
MNRVLIVVDMQNDFVSGSLGTKEAQAIVPNVVKKIKEYSSDKTYNEILFTMDMHTSNYLNTLEGKYLPVEHCIENTYGCELVDEVKELNNGYTTYLKSGFGSIKLFDYLYEIPYDCFDEIEVIGLCTDICVISNVLMLRSGLPDKKITVDASCCAGTTPEKHKAALEVMKSCQIEIINE